MYQGEFNLVKRLWYWNELLGEPTVIRILTDLILKERRQSQKDQQDLVAKMTSEGHKMDPTEFEEKSNFVLSKTPAGKPFTSDFSVETEYFSLRENSAFSECKLWGKWNAKKMVCDTSEALFG